jgi:hypothetical protein
MYTVNELRKFLAELQDDDVGISLALEFTKDALAFEEQPLLSPPREFLESRVRVMSALSDHQLLLAVTASTAVDKNRPCLLRAIAIRARNMYALEDVLLDALSRACLIPNRIAFDILSDFVRDRPVVSAAFARVCMLSRDTALALRRLHKLGAECSEKSFTAAVFAGNESAIRLHMCCTEHDAYFFAPRMKTIAPNEHILKALDEPQKTSQSVDEWVII